MKKFLSILIIVCAFSQAQAQRFIKYADTANYLIHQIENKKNLFIGKPLSVLLDSLKIQPVDAFSGNGTAKNDAFGARIFFDFNYEREFIKSHYIIVHFTSPPPYAQTRLLFFPPQGGFGSVQSIISAYKNVIVKDVLVKDYNGGDYIDPDVHY